MDFLKDTKLASYTTMRLGGPAKYIAVIDNEQDVVSAVDYATKHSLPIITIGSGSNIIFGNNGFKGVVLVNKISGLKIDTSVGFIEAGAGELTDKVVQMVLDTGLTGIEALSGIPGTIGAAPVNNIGAYGQEIKDSILKIRAYDTTKNQFIELKNEDCQFSYRNSIFKTKEHGRFIITKLYLQLKKYEASNYQPPNYPSLLAELAKRNLVQPTTQDIRQVVLDLRREKLPDPAILANTGSFFKNQIVNQELIDKFLIDYPDMPHYPQKDNREKLSAAWLIEKCGLKNLRQNGFWVYDKQPLVLANESSSNFDELKTVSDHIVNTVQKQFGVTLEIEPELVNS